MAIQAPARPVDIRPIKSNANGSRTHHIPINTTTNGNLVFPSPRNTPDKTIERLNKGSDMATILSISAANAITAGSEEKIWASGVARKKRNNPPKHPDHNPADRYSLKANRNSKTQCSAQNFAVWPQRDGE